MEAVGYRYKYDPATDQFAHASGIMVLTPEGRLSRYFYGVEYSPRDVRLGLVEASQKQDRQRGRSNSAVLLPLRPGHRQVRRRGDEPDTFRRRSLYAGLRRIPVHLSAPRSAAVTGTLSGGLDSSRWVNSDYFRYRPPRSLPRWITCCISLLAITVFFTLLIFGAIFYFAIRYRRRSERELPHVVAHRLTRWRFLWSVIPFGLTMVMFTWGASIFFTASKPPNDAIQIYAVGKQWMWKLQHLEGQREINELHIPVGTPVRVTMASEDVIHSFFVPAFRTKQDVVPGRYTTTVVQAHQAGKVSPLLRRILRYQPFRHDRLGIRHGAADYQNWLSGGASKARSRKTARNSSNNSPAATATRKTTPAAVPTWSEFSASRCNSPAAEP